jgi:hypothetical protein
MKLLNSSPIKHIEVVDGYAYLAGGGAALVVLDVSDARNPEWIGEFRTNNVAGNNVHGEAVEVHGRYAYLSFGEVGFFVPGVRDPSRPVTVREVWPEISYGAEFMYVLHVADRHAFMVIKAIKVQNGKVMLQFSL